MISVARFFTALFITLCVIAFIGLVCVAVLALASIKLTSDLGLFLFGYGFVLFHFFFPAVIVACFRYQYSIKKRVLAALKAILVTIFALAIWQGIGELGLPKLMAPLPGVYNGVEIFFLVCLIFLSGLLTSRFLSVVDLPPIGPRPFTIRLFEYVFFFQVGLVVLNGVLGYDLMIANYQDKVAINPAKAITSVLAFKFILTFTWMAVIGAVVFLIVRFGSVMARNTYVLIFFLTLLIPLFLIIFGKTWELEAFLSTGLSFRILFSLGVAASLVAVGLLFSKSARAWINREGMDQHSGELIQN